MGKSASTLARPYNSMVFNRHTEVRNLVHKVTKCHPGLILITGPPDSGKTSVLKEVMTVSKNDCQWFHVDMRQPGNSWDNIPSMYNSLYRAFSIFNSSRYNNPIKALEMTTNFLSWFTFKFNLRLHKRSPPDADDVKNLLFAIEKKIVEKKRSVSKPVIFLDEANHMYGCLDNTTEGKMVLNCFMEFVHRNTKQNANFHVVLASSSSLFVRQIMKDSTSRSSIFVIGDLNKQHAEKFWQWMENPENLEYPEHPRIPKFKCSLEFEEAYCKVGGHMFDLRRVFTALDPKLELDQMIATTREKLTVLVSPNSRIGWNKDQGKEIARGLCEKGYMEVRPLQEKYGYDWLEAMIKDHVVCYRPGPVWSDDLCLQEQNIEYPIITAPTPLHLWVLKNSMKELLQE